MQNLFKFIPLLSIALLLSCGGSGQTESTESEASQKTKVRVEEVKLVPVDQISTFTATVEADKVNNIAPAMGGRIREIYVEVGSQVRKGQVLVAMDASTYSQQETQVATLRRDFERYKELYEVGGISKQQLDQVKTQLDVAETAMNNLGENTKLVSPLNGVVTARNYDPGDVAMQLPILTIESMNPVKVTLNVSERFYSQVKIGMPVEVQADALGDEVFEGKISLIYPTIDPVSHTFTVEVSVPNNNQKLRPGMFSRVKMNFGTNDRPLLSDLAVLKQVGSNDRYVFVEENGKAKYTIVQLGARIDDKYEIISGLNAGDKVIIHGNTNLIDGSEVEVID
ncbi:MAG TPA: efflux RND transporter periplasmic adaptor subunit [Fermentimonas caenicola]|nr:MULTISPECIES: efflux RND transporter periplasmic adaptor subunit [Lascolabacillus]MBP6174645.1 efflux RND transporter periplasmic adaptor subunit [Fermentimonas sp.]MDI9624988.1 efflux RND transporter periplasmic adaptor subunit [Bacteroidota bacterium]TAH61580.1 MAG: efflux RND transporter periplasmic adaptor subunit [Fermentimonas caenicola]MBP6196877.1 efflux RND transporter periplasmic adaptor subunit [Fermentimonas sp.]MBP7104355.1 efflux RND transporter periplasmic adaptor subunit [Fe